MNSEIYIKEIKENFKNVKEWSEEELKDHYESFEEGYINEINNDFVSSLKSC